MKFVRRFLAACLVSTLGALSGPALADGAPVVNSATALVVLNAFGTGFANLRAAPDPRSEAVLKVAAGATDLHPTGAVKRYGDTWWLEVRTGTVTAWLNARLAGYAPAGTPLQVFINIDALQPMPDYAFKGAAYLESEATSFEECARRCVGDDKCQAVEFAHAPPVCRLFDQRPDIVKQAKSDVAAKAAEMPAGGWSSQIQSRIERVQEQTILAQSNRERITHSADECAAECSYGQSCAAYTYQRKSLLCSMFKQTAKSTPRPGSESGVNSAMIPAVPPAPAPAPKLTAVAPVALQKPVALPKTAAVPASAPRDAQAIEPLFKHVLEEAGRTAAYASPEINRQGRIRIKARAAALADAGAAMGLGAPLPPQVLAQAFEGDVNNLAPLLDASKPGMVHLVFYAQPMSPPLVIASAAHETAEDAAAAALKMQKDLDEIARNAGLMVDQLALLKPLRR